MVKVGFGSPFLCVHVYFGSADHEVHQLTCIMTDRFTFFLHEKKAQLEIKESVEALKKKLQNNKHLKVEKRIKSLIAIKESKFKTQQEVADYVVVSIRTLERWVDTYKTEGLDSLLVIKPKKSKFITPYYS